MLCRGVNLQHPLLLVALISLLVAGLTEKAETQEASGFSSLDCGYLPPDQWLQEVRAAVGRGEIADPLTRALPLIPDRESSTFRSRGSGLTVDDIFPYEDSDQLLLTNFSGGELLNLMAEAANELLSVHGDLFDFVGYWVNFTPDHTIGAAFYSGMQSSTTGIGQAPFDNRAAFGLAGEKIQGFVMMWNINSSWQSGAGPGASFTRLVLGQEFGHRFGMFLPDLLDGRRLQGDNGSCGRAAHWNWRVDGQGSSMEISNWVGANPATLAANFVSFNTDISTPTDMSVFSYTDLYLMGYVSPAEMDAGNSELRYMDTSSCSGSYSGTISTFSSADIIAAAGARVPDSTNQQQNYRTGWIMIHLPGNAPDQAELQKAVDIHTQHEIDWNFGTLGRGIMDNSLPDPVPPVVSSVDPDQGPLRGGTSVTVVGQNFGSNANVRFGNAQASVEERLGTTSIVVSTPPGESEGGIVDLTVTQQGGSDTLGSAYTYTPNGPALEYFSGQTRVGRTFRVKAFGEAGESFAVVADARTGNCVRGGVPLGLECSRKFQILYNSFNGFGGLDDPLTSLGERVVQVAIPNDPNLVFRSFHVQAIIRDSSGGSPSLQTSDVLRFTVLP